MDRMDEIRLAGGVYDILSATDSNRNGDGDSMIDELEELPTARRLRVAGGDFWDCILHVLPPGKEWRGRWPTGSWAVVKALTGVAEISMLRGPNRDGFFTKATKKNLRGGGDGSNVVGGSSSSVGGEDCVKYVGGAFRSYGGKSGKTTILEVVVRPPIGKENLDGDGKDSLKMELLNDLVLPDDVLMVVPTQAESEEQPDTDDTTEEQVMQQEETTEKGHLGRKMGMSFDNKAMSSTSGRRSKW